MGCVMYIVDIWIYIGNYLSIIDKLCLSHTCKFLKDVYGEIDVIKYIKSKLGFSEDIYKAMTRHRIYVCTPRIHRILHGCYELSSTTWFIADSDVCPRLIHFNHPNWKRYSLLAKIPTIDLLVRYYNLIDTDKNWLIKQIVLDTKYSLPSKACGYGSMNGLIKYFELYMVDNNILMSVDINKYNNGITNYTDLVDLILTEKYNAGSVGMLFDGSRVYIKKGVPLSFSHETRTVSVSEISRLTRYRDPIQVGDNVLINLIDGYDIMNIKN